jgi:hypothetical protein
LNDTQVRTIRLRLWSKEVVKHRPMLNRVLNFPPLQAGTWYHAWVLK